jgi:hypothetical protein
MSFEELQAPALAGRHAAEQARHPLEHLLRARVVVVEKQRERVGRLAHFSAHKDLTGLLQDPGEARPLVADLAPQPRDLTRARRHRPPPR